MGRKPAFIALAATIMAVTLITATPAEARCKKFGFTVNDYGKTGPTNEAKRLLDVFIKEWMGKNGVKNWSTRPKTVKCELFIDVGLFDEYTCRADTTACW
ncbi:MAG: hypothetical protein DHS20C08_07410 [Rhodomicrobium sp.]|nr:MAG: hypothetical protein DHS20C08_07410 [Rhodomicrobium sp.]